MQSTTVEKCYLLKLKPLDCLLILTDNVYIVINNKHLSLSIQTLFENNITGFHFENQSIGKKIFLRINCKLIFNINLIRTEIQYVLETYITIGFGDILFPVYILLKFYTKYQHQQGLYTHRLMCTNARGNNRLISIRFYFPVQYPDIILCS